MRRGLDIPPYRRFVIQSLTLVSGPDLVSETLRQLIDFRVCVVGGSLCLVPSATVRVAWIGIIAVPAGSRSLDLEPEGFRPLSEISDALRHCSRATGHDQA